MLWGVDKKRPCISHANPSEYSRYSTVAVERWRPISLISGDCTGNKSVNVSLANPLGAHQKMELFSSSFPPPCVLQHCRCLSFLCCEAVNADVLPKRNRVGAGDRQGGRTCLFVFCLSFRLEIAVDHALLVGQSNQSPFRFRTQKIPTFLRSLSVISIFYIINLPVVVVLSAAFFIKAHRRFAKNTMYV